MAAAASMWPGGNSAWAQFGPARTDFSDLRYEVHTGRVMRSGDCHKSLELQ